VICETDRLIIRKFTTRDLNKLHAILSDAEVMLYSLYGPYSLEQTDTFLKGTLNAYHSRGYAQYAVILKDSKELIGFCGFFNQEIENVIEMELGYRFSKKHWGQGYACEAAIACRDYAFSELGAKKLISIIDPNNVASIKVAEKAGLRLEKSTYYHDIMVLIYSIHSYAIIK
jgi:RimJ/RimL family protein N-acetyltransferase